MKKKAQLHVYVSDEDEPMVEDMKKLGKELHINPSRFVMASLKACWPTLRDKAPKERSFKMNGRTIIV